MQDDNRPTKPVKARIEIGTRGSVTAELERLKLADPLIDVVDDLGRAICLLRTVHIALEHPSLYDLYGLDDCSNALAFVTADVDKIRKRANAAVKDLTEIAP